jgi:hypothetical protein
MTDYLKMEFAAIATFPLNRATNGGFSWTLQIKGVGCQTKHLNIDADQLNAIYEALTGETTKADILNEAAKSLDQSEADKTNDALTLAISAHLDGKTTDATKAEPVNAEAVKLLKWINKKVSNPHGVDGDDLQTISDKINKLLKG